MNALATQHHNLAVQAPRCLPLAIAGQQSMAIWEQGSTDWLVLMISGGAQTRCGSHRMQQQIAKQLLVAGISSIRFDFPGFGDASGAPANFQQHSRWLPSICQQIRQHVPPHHKLVLFGLCDGATASLLSLPDLRDIAAIVLLNPWLRQAENHQQTMLKYYYWQRIRQKQFWIKFFKGQFSVLSKVKAVLMSLPKTNSTLAANSVAASTTATDFATEALTHWSQCQLPILLTLSQTDLTAQECQNLLQSKRWRVVQQHPLLKVLKLEQANHTLSNATHLQHFVTCLSQWLLRLP